MAFIDCSDSTATNSIPYREAVYSDDGYLVGYVTWTGSNYFDATEFEREAARAEARRITPPNPCDLLRPQFALKPADAQRGLMVSCLPRARIVRWRSLKEKRMAWGIKPSTVMH